MEFYSDEEYSDEIDEIPEDDFEERFEKASRVYNRLKNYCEFHALGYLKSKENLIIKIMNFL